MRRAGGWILGLIVVAAMAAGGWLAFRPILNRETIRIGFIAHPNAHPPSQDAMVSGAQFAVEERGSRAGGHRIVFTPPGTVYHGEEAELWLEVHPSPLLNATIQQVDSPAHPSVSVLPDLSRQGRAAADWAKSTGARTLLLLHDPDNPSSVEILKSFMNRAREAGLSFADPVSTGVGSDGVLEKMRSNAPDLIYYCGEAAPYSTAFDVFRTLREKGYRGTLAMADADAEVSFLAVQKHVVDGTYLISPISPPATEFAARYEPATKRLAGPHAWPAYLTMNALLDLIDRSGTGNTNDLVRVLTAHPPAVRPCALYVHKGGKFEFVQDLK